MPFTARTFSRAPYSDNRTGQSRKNLRRGTTCFSVDYHLWNGRLKAQDKELGPHFERHQRVASTKEGFETGSNAAHMRLVGNAIYRRASQEDIQYYRRNRLRKTGAAQRRSSPKKCRLDLHERSTPPSALVNEDGTFTSSWRRWDGIDNKKRESFTFFAHLLPRRAITQPMVKNRLRFLLQKLELRSHPFLRAARHSLYRIIHVPSYIHVSSYIHMPSTETIVRPREELESCPFPRCICYR